MSRPHVALRGTFRDPPGTLFMQPALYDIMLFPPDHLPEVIMQAPIGPAPPSPRIEPRASPRSRSLFLHRDVRSHFLQGSLSTLGAILFRRTRVCRLVPAQWSGPATGRLGAHASSSGLRAFRGIAATSDRHVPATAQAALTYRGRRKVMFPPFFRVANQRSPHRSGRPAGDCAACSLEDLRA